MYEFAIELILVVLIAVPLIAGARQPARVASRSHVCLPRKRRRNY